MKRHMNHRRTEQNPAALAARREGSTLTEVLVALLIMSIGLVSVAVMFPLSVLRSIKGAQLTAATDARYNAEGALAMYPNILDNPLFFVQNGGLSQYTLNSSNFIIDPLGSAVVSQSNPTLAQYFGNDPNMVAPSGVLLQPKAGSWVLPRLNLGLSNEPAADFVVTSPDSWVLQYEGFANGNTLISDPKSQQSGNITQVNVIGLGATGFTLPVSPNPGVVDAPTARAVIFSADGLTSQARIVTSVGIRTTGALAADTIDTIKWTEDVDSTGVYSLAKDLNRNGVLDDNPLPASLLTKGVGKVRIETQERRYSWLLTVRKDEAGGANVDVVVFFKRPLETIFIDELLYPAFFTAGNTTVSVNYSNAVNKPFMQKGNFIFDANNCFWYRISNVFDPGTGKATITLDTPANYSSPISGNNRAMFPRNIVDVYPIGAK